MSSSKLVYTTLALGGLERTNQILAVGWELMVLCQIIEELLDVATPVVDGAGSHKAVRLLRAVGAVPQLPVRATEVSGLLLAANQGHVPVMSEPADVSQGDPPSTCFTHQIMSP
jgi:hypothetical protein